MCFIATYFTISIKSVVLACQQAYTHTHTHTHSKSPLWLTLYHNSNFDMQPQASPTERNNLNSRITGRKADWLISCKFFWRRVRKKHPYPCAWKKPRHTLLSTPWQWNSLAWAAPEPTVLQGAEGQGEVVLPGHKAVQEPLKSHNKS